MKDILSIFSVANNIISPLGVTTAQNFSACRQGQTGIQSIENGQYYPEHFQGAIIDRAQFYKTVQSNASETYTFLEQLFIRSITEALSHVATPDKSRTLLVISTTKGNIDLLTANNNTFPAGRLKLHHMAQVINDHFELPNPPIVVSNACISGLSAIITAKRLIASGKYDHAIVSGGDILSEFVISGFHSLKAISDAPCRPYDAVRNGITLGEACGTMVLSKDETLARDSSSIVKVLSGAQTNDANHISGPSRTGEGLKLAIKKALGQAKLSPGSIDFVNAHGTATIFNDEMESLAFDAMDFGGTPLNSLKGYFGHTLGAAGILEAIISVCQLQARELLPSKGYTSHGVSKSLNIVAAKTKADSMKYVLKTTSGFGGCNAAVILEKL